MCLKAASCSDSTQFLDHKMKLIVPKASVTVDASSVPSMDGGMGRVYWELDGPSMFTKGMAANGVDKSGVTASNPATVPDPFGPIDPNDDDSWNNLVWVPGPEKPKANVSDLASRYLDLIEGKLTVLKSENEEARIGRWVFADGQGNVLQKRALTDNFQLEWSSNDGISIQTSGGSIVFTPKTNKLAMRIRHELNPAHVSLSNGVKLPHFSMLYDFVDGKSCDTAIVPTYEKRTDLNNQGTPTPGDLCPPMWLDQTV